MTEENDYTHECFFCHETHEEDEMEHALGYGWVCHWCIQGIRSRGEPIYTSPAKFDERDYLRDIGAVMKDTGDVILTDNEFGCLTRAIYDARDALHGHMDDHKVVNALLGTTVALKMIDDINERYKG